MTYMFERITKLKAPLPKPHHLGPKAQDTFCEWDEGELSQKMAGLAKYDRISQKEHTLKAKVFCLMQDGRERTMADISRATGARGQVLSGTVRELSKSGCLTRSKIKETSIWRLSEATS